jgi:uncharacterized RDD family membrane protein YckC
MSAFADADSLGMGDLIERRGIWWQERQDGTWLRWSEQTATWEPQDMPPPPPMGAQTGAVTMPKGMVAAEWWQRAVAAIIDIVVVTLGIWLLFLVSRLGEHGWFFLASAFLFQPCYYTAFHGTTGQTFGKELMHIHVCDERSGQLIGARRAFLRWLCAVLMGAALYVPGIVNLLWPLWDARNQALHDKIVKSLVVVGDPKA